MTDEMNPRPARKHDHAVEVYCPSCRNPALVIGYMVDGYRCQFCKVLCTVTGRFASLGAGGALPDAVSVKQFRADRRGPQGVRADRPCRCQAPGRRPGTAHHLW